MTTVTIDRDICRDFVFSLGAGHRAAADDPRYPVDPTWPGWIPYALLGHMEPIFRRTEGHVQARGPGAQALMDSLFRFAPDSRDVAFFAGRGALFRFARRGRRLRIDHATVTGGGYASLPNPPVASLFDAATAFDEEIPAKVDLPDAPMTPEALLDAFWTRINPALGTLMVRQPDDLPWAGRTFLRGDEIEFTRAVRAAFHRHRIYPASAEFFTHPDGTPVLGKTRPHLQSHERVALERRLRPILKAFRIQSNRPSPRQDVGASALRHFASAWRCHPVAFEVEIHEPSAHDRIAVADALARYGALFDGDRD